MTDKNYDLYSIEKDLIEELEDNQEEILESNGDNLHEYVDSNISVYTYDQIMIYANNSELWGNDIIREQIVTAIFEKLSDVLKSIRIASLLPLGLTGGNQVDVLPADCEEGT